MKKNILWIILALVFVAVFNVIFFITGGYKEATASRWVGYGMIHFSYILMVLMPVITAKSKTDRAFGIPVSMLMVIYFAIEFVAGLLFIIINDGLTAQIIVHTLITGLFVAAIVALLIADTSATEKQETRNVSGEFAEKLTELLAKMRNAAETDEHNAMLEELYQAALSAPRESSGDAAEVETCLLTRVKDLKVALEMKDAERISECGADVRELISKRTQIL